MFEGFHELFGYKLQKVADFVKNHEKSSIWLKFDALQAKRHVKMF